MIVKKISIREQVYGLIKKRILTREYEPGDKINISTLAADLKVSNTPVREALSMLQQDGLVNFTTNLGYQVFAFTEEDITALENTMSILMMGGYELCRFHDKTGQLTAMLETKLAHQEALLTSDAQEEMAYRAIEFDAAFFNVLPNKAISDLYQNLLNKMVLLICYDYRRNLYDLSKSCGEHRQILDAVRADDPILVNRLIAQHFNRDILLD